MAETLNDAVLEQPIVTLSTQRPTHTFAYYLRTMRGRVVRAAAVQLNSVQVTELNLSDTTPAAPAGGVNVQWSTDAETPQNISAHVSPNAVSNTVLADMPPTSLKGRRAGSTGDPENLVVIDTDTIEWNFLQPGELRADINQLDTGWDATNVTTTKTFDANTVLLAELADVVGTLINRLVALNILGPAA